jgi:MFS family permease
MAEQHHNDIQTVIRTPPPVRTNSDITQEVSGDVADAPQKDTQKSPPLRSLLTRPVVITIVNYAILAFFDMSSIALIPLIWSTPIEFGGLNLSPASIGLGMSAFGCMSGTFQFAVFPPLAKRFGLRWIFVVSIAVCAVIFALFPLENLTLRHAIGGHPTVTTWSLILLQLGLLGIHKMAFGKSLLSFSLDSHVDR